MPAFLDIHPDLCHNCGTCVAVCPQKALSTAPDVPRLTGDCVQCGLCYRLCPGIDVDFFKLNRLLYPDKIPDVYFGCYTEMKLGRAKGHSLTLSSSGGVVTALLKGALESGMIRSAVVVTMDSSMPLAARVHLARTAQDIEKASGSKYILAPVNSILSKISSFDGPIALVGLPCHIHGLRKMREEDHPATRSISYVIGLFCGFNLTSGAVPFLLKKMGISPEEVARVHFRYGEWPGHFLVETCNGAQKILPKAEFNLLHWLYLPPRCSLCPDLFAELADISVGDYWPRNSTVNAYSSIIVRNRQGREILNTACDSGTIETTPLPVKELFLSHSHLIDYKKRAVFVRLFLSRRRPLLPMRRPHLFLKEYITAALFSFFLGIGRTISLRKAAYLLPLCALGKGARLLRSLSRITSRRSSRRYWTLAEVGEHWDHTDEYDEINARTYSYARRFVDGYELSAPYIPENASVLDISCRTGRGSLYFGSRREIRLTGMTPSSSQARRARELCESEGVSFTALEWRNMRIPFPQETFDFIISFETIEHVFQYEDFVRELHRVLKKGGGLLLTTPNILWDPLHSLAALLRMHHSEGPHRFLPRRELLRVLTQNGFDIKREMTTVLFAFGPSWLTRLGERVERALPAAIKRILCLRRILLCLKRC